MERERDYMRCISKDQNMAKRTSQMFQHQEKKWRRKVEYWYVLNSQYLCWVMKGAAVHKQIEIMNTWFLCFVYSWGEAVYCTTFCCWLFGSLFYIKFLCRMNQSVCRARFLPKKISTETSIVIEIICEFRTDNFVCAG